MKELLKEMRTLLKQREEFLNLQYNDFSDKIEGNAFGGAKVEIYWKDRIYEDDEEMDLLETNPDIGYIFYLDGMSVDENDFFIHITYMDADTEEIWLHVGDLLSNEEVGKIIISEA